MTSDAWMDVPPDAQLTNVHLIMTFRNPLTSGIALRKTGNPRAAQVMADAAKSAAKEDIWQVVAGSTGNVTLDPQAVESHALIRCYRSG